MSQIRWVVQKNLGKDEDAFRIQKECLKLGHLCDLLDIIPFSGTLPNIDNDLPSVFYGGTNWTSSIHKSRQWRPAVWYDEERFAQDAVVENYGEFALNEAAQFCSFQEFIEAAEQKEYPDDRMFFIRPLKDLKEFHGDVVRFGDFSSWYDRIRYGDVTITPNTQIVVNDPFKIHNEWRCFVVLGKVSSASLYRQDHQLTVQPGARPDVIEFAERMAGIWSPSSVFVLDIAECDRLYAIETNCFNSSGFYACDVEKVVRDVSLFVSEVY